ncbi:MAG: hypothetical protein LBB58_02405 [Cellulomonadaceae bacterium]|jgi:hypothetical protein|nr:hypothetical protein [Cellulomonadaceae bacterium]
MVVSPEQYAATQKNVSTAAQLAYSWWCATHREATREEAFSEVQRVIERYGQIEAQVAVAFYMNQRGIADGWQMLPSGGIPDRALSRLLAAAWQQDAPSFGLRQVIDRAVKAYGRRTIERGRGQEIG